MAYKKISGIYKITNKLNNKIYIGQSKWIKTRLTEHRNDLRNNKHQNQHLQNAWNKYKGENFKFEILEECSIDELDDKEIYWIKYYDSCNRSMGYNIESGGFLNKEVTTETRKKLSDINKLNGLKGEQCHSAKYTNEQILNAKKLICDNIDLLEISKTTSITMRDIHRIKNLETWKSVGKNYNEKLKSMKFESYRLVGEIIKFDKLMNKICTYNNLEEASIDNSVKKYAIQCSYLFYRITSNNYIFLKKDEYLEENILKKKCELIDNGIYMIKEINSQGDTIKYYNSASECARELKLDSSSILKVCNGKVKQTKGHIFKKEFCKI